MVIKAFKMCIISNFFNCEKDDILWDWGEEGKIEMFKDWFHMTISVNVKFTKLFESNSNEEYLDFPDE